MISIFLNDCIYEVDYAVVGQDVGDDDRRLATSAVKNQCFMFNMDWNEMFLFQYRAHWVLRLWVKRPIWL